jgi:protein-disulfide isomerase
VAPPPIEDARGIIAAERVRHIAGTGDLAIIEFTDFQCPFCARHATETAPALMELAGVRYVSLHLPLDMHPQAIPAAEAAECAAEQGQFWAMHAALFAGQEALKAGVIPHLEGLDDERFSACLEADVALARVTADQQEAERLQVNSTPTLFIGRMRPDGGVDLLKRISGARPAETFVAEVAKLTKG